MRSGSLGRLNANNPAAEHPALTMKSLRYRRRGRLAKEQSMSIPALRSKTIRRGVSAFVALVIVVAAVASTKVLSADEANAAAQAGSFEPAAFAAEHFTADIVPGIEDNATDLATLLTDLAGGAEEADFGHSVGSASSYSYPVTFTGVAGEPNGSVVPVTVDGVPAGTAIQVQIGPALNGTAIRDATGTVEFNGFSNQLEFQQVATEFNNLVKTDVLAAVTPATLNGQTITVTGAFTRVNPALVSVVPIAFEVQQ